MDEALQILRSHKKQKNEDSFDVFGRHIANEVRALNSGNAQRWVKFETQELIFQAQFSPQLHQSFWSAAPDDTHSTLPNAANFSPQFISQRLTTTFTASNTLSREASGNTSANLSSSPSGASHSVYDNQY